MAQPRRILIVDDDPQIREVIRFALERAGFDTFEAGDGRQALERCEREMPALIILDILMPEMDGTEVCRELTARARVPIIFLTSVDEEVERIVGLELGADDYVTKPFSPRELVARVRAVLRRTDPPDSPEPSMRDAKLTFGELSLDPARFEASWGGHDLALTATEFRLLRVLIGYPGKVFSRDELMSEAYTDGTVVSARTIDSHVRRLRAKLTEVGAGLIETVHGVGYRLGP